MLFVLVRSDSGVMNFSGIKGLSWNEFKPNLETLGEGGGENIG